MRRKMARTRQWKYVHNPMGDLDELYDLTVDPAELTNVAGDARYAAALAEMRLRLADWSIHTEDALAVLTLIDAIEELDDVSKVYHNLELTEDMVAQYA